MNQSDRLLSSQFRIFLIVLVLLGALAFVAGVRSVPDQTWLNFLLSSFYFLGLSAIAVLFIAMHALGRAGWHVAFRRIPEAMAGYLPIGALLMLLLAGGLHSVYEWSHTDVVAQDPILTAKSAYLNESAFIVRMVIFLLLWIGLSYLMNRNSRAQDADGDVARTQRGVVLAAVYAVVFAISFTLASIDWIMSIEPHWYSTLFPWYVFSGVLVNGCAVIAILLMLLKQKGLYVQVGENHLHDLGKLVFAFSFFWGYLWFSQYMLIWYSNIPEETVHFFWRESIGWNLLFLLNPIINVVIPFVVLLPARHKMTERILFPVCVLLLLGHFVDLVLMIQPSRFPDGPQFSLRDAAMFLGVAALFLLSFDYSFTRADPIPSKDPYLVESLHH